MPAKTSGWIADGDVDVSLSERTPQYGRRLAMDINESVLVQIGSRALEEATKRLGAEAAYEHQHEISGLVATLLLDAEWIKPIIEQEVRQAARQMMLSLWSDEEKKAQREWFDLFHAALTRAT